MIFMLTIYLNALSFWNDFSGLITGVASVVAVLFSMFAALSPLGERDRFYKLLEGQVFERKVVDLVDRRISDKNLATKEDITHLNQVVNEMRDDIKYLIRKGDE